MIVTGCLKRLSKKRKQNEKKLMDKDNSVVIAKGRQSGGR